MVDLSGYKLTFDDEFNTRSISQDGVGTTWSDIRPQWRYDSNSDIGFGHSSFVDRSSGYNPFKVSNGTLSITAVPDRTASGYPGSWESGLISTEGSFSQTYGYFEMRAKLANNPGSWDAFWLLPDAPTANQELDVVEHYGNNSQGTYSTIHTTDAVPSSALQVYSEDSARTSGYHTYGMDWEPHKITFYVDGKPMGSQATPSDMHSSMYLLADLATEPNADDAGTPITTKIDYIRAYSKDASARAVKRDTVSSPEDQDPGLYGATAAADPEPTPTADSATNSGSATPTVTTVGSGTDQLLLHLSEDAYKGDAQYTVSVDGQQIGGTQTAHAAHGSATDSLLVQGDWAAGDHTVSVAFLNDLYEGTSSDDRNLYINGATYNRVDVAGAQNSLMSSGSKSFSVHDIDPATTPAAATPSSPVASGSATPVASGSATPVASGSATPVASPTSTSIGSGADQLLLHMSEDAYKGDAQYTVSVDGQQIGGTQTAHAAHGSATDSLLVQGDWAAGDHTVSIAFLNDLFEGTSSADRNLYINGADFNGVDVAGAQNSLMSSGAKSFLLHDATLDTTTPAATSSSPAASGSATPTSIAIGSGADQLLLHMSEDAYRGDAQYTVSVDGQQIGGTQTAHAAHGSATDSLLVQGDWAAGNHTVSIDFLNDLFAGTSTTDRNLYINGATYNGVDVAGAQNSLMSSGSKSFSVHDTDPATTPAAATPSSPVASGSATPVASPTSTSIGSGADQLLLHMSEDAYKGDAQYTVSVDGQQIGGTQTAHAAHGSATDSLLVQGDWAAGDHTVSIAFLNDLYEGGSSADRNLYINGAALNGTYVDGSQHSLMSSGAQAFTFHSK